MSDQHAVDDGDSTSKNRAGRKWAEGLRDVAGTTFDLQRIRRAAVAIWMNFLIVAVVAVAAATTGLLAPITVFPDPTWPLRALTLFAIWLLSFVPGWLYVRFLCLRKEALWSEYVMTLYRLGVDEPRYLPPPPTESMYDRLALAHDGGEEHTNIYRQKFNAFYGRKVSAGRHPSHTGYVNVDTLFPVFLCTVTLAVAWTVILWNPNALMDPVAPWATLMFGFLGAYAFAVSMLIRRFYQSDLRPSAYAAVVLRIVVVLVMLVVVHQLFQITDPGGATSLATEYVSAFVIGFFPLVGLQALQRIAAKALRVVVPTMSPEYPLDQIDGLNIWYEARLIEEGVEDMQNLATVNLVDVILHTRAPVGRLIDWIDQAYLLIHLSPANRKEIKSARKSADSDANPASARVALRRIGIRSATDFVRTFASSDGTHHALTGQQLTDCGLDPSQITTLARLLATEPGLDPVWNWKSGGAGRIAKPRIGMVAPGEAA